MYITVWGGVRGGGVYDDWGLPVLEIATCATEQWALEPSAESCAFVSTVPSCLIPADKAHKGLNADRVLQQHTPAPVTFLTLTEREIYSERLGE